MLQQLLHGQASGSMEMAKKISELHNKLDCSYNDLNVKVETLNTKVRHLEGHSTSSSASKQISQLPGKAIKNPKEYAHAITLRSGKALPTREKQRTVTEDSEDQDGEDLSLGKDQVEKTTRSTTRAATRPHTRAITRAATGPRYSTNYSTKLPSNITNCSKTSCCQEQRKGLCPSSLQTTASISWPLQESVSRQV